MSCVCVCFGFFLNVKGRTAEKPEQYFKGKTTFVKACVCDASDLSKFCRIWEKKQTNKQNIKKRTTTVSKRNNLEHEGQAPITCIAFQTEPASRATLLLGGNISWRHDPDWQRVLFKVEHAISTCRRDVPGLACTSLSNAQRRGAGKSRRNNNKLCNYGDRPMCTVSVDGGHIRCTSAHSR